MICVMFRNMADLYAEGRLAGFQAKWIERHAASCPDCAAELAAWKRMFAGLRTSRSPAPKPLKKCFAALNRKLRPNPRKRSGIVLPGRRWEPSMALAAGLLALALSVLSPL